MDNFRRKMKFQNVIIKGNKFPTMYHMYDENGVYKGKINHQYETMQNCWLKGICIFLETEQGKIVMEQRANTKLNPYEADFCSGHVENYETYMQAAYREAREELGIKEHQLQKLTLIGKEVPLIFAGRKFLIQFLYAKIHSKDIQKDNEEVENYYQEEAKVAFQKIREGKTKFPYEGNEESLEKIITIVQEKMDPIQEKIEREK